MADTATQKAIDLGILKDQNWIKRFNTANSLQNRIALLRNYKIQDQAEEALIQLILDRLDPPKASISHVSLVRKEMEKLEATGYKIDTPEEETRWQIALDNAQALDESAAKAILAQHMEEVKRALPDIDISMFTPTGPVTISVPHPEAKKQEPISVAAPVQKNEKMDIVPTPLDKLEGLTVASQKKLQDAGITTVEGFFALNQKEAQKILQNEVIVARFAARLKSDPGTMI